MYFLFSYLFLKDRYDLVLLDLKMPQLDDIVIFHPLKNRDPNVTICIITADFSYFGQLKEKIPNIEKYIIHKPIQNTRNQYYLHGIN